MTDKQVKIINEKMHIIEPCVKFACDFLILPDIEVRFEDCPSARFPSMDNAAESGLRSDGQGLILINGPWFADRVNDHQDDVEFFIFHELRHLHQQKQIQLMDSGKRTREPLDIIKKWKNDFYNYIRNEGKDTQLANISQEIEVDANAYGIIMEMLYRDGRQPLLSIPKEASDLAEARLQRYIDTLPEFKRYSPKSNNV